MKRAAIYGGIVWAGFLAICGNFSFQAVPAMAQEPIKIGLIHSMSGGGAMYGEAARDGGQIAIDEINKAGGVLGRPLKLVVRDDKLNPQVGLREAKDMVLNEKVDFLAGTVSSGVAAAVSSYAREAKKIFIIQVATSPLLTEENGHRYVFRFSANLTNLVAAAAKACAKVWGDKKVFSLGPDYEYGHTLNKIFWYYYKQYVPDSKSVGELWTPLGTKDFTPYISKMMASDAQMVAASIFGGDALTFIKQAYPMGFFSKFHYYNGADGDVETMHVIKPGEPSSKGGIGVARYPYWEKITPKSLEFAKKFQSQTGKLPPYGASYMYIIVYALKDAIEKAGSVDTEKVINAMEGRTFDTIFGKVEVRACDHQAMMPSWVGIMDFSSDIAFPHVTQLEKFDNPYVIYNSCKDIEAARKAQKK